MRIHHLNCISSCPLGGVLMDGSSIGLRGRLACHCMLVEANWHEHSVSAGERWFGFECVRALAGLPPEILMIPLPGHTFGHAGVAHPQK